MAQSIDIAKIKNLPVSPQTLGGPTAFVIFGATGDLSTKKIFPSFFKLYKNKLLPQIFEIIACARTAHTNESFIKILEESIKVDDHLPAEFTSKIQYVSLDIAESKNLASLALALDAFEKESKVCPKRIFYMAISPKIYESAFNNLGKTKLNLGCQTHGSKARIVVEKPFGRDFESAKKINATLSEYFDEDQIYRIDHFLGKETVQNIFAFRFGNELFEPIWNNHFIDHIQINLTEHVGIEKRGDYYDHTGALRDMVQNHMLQLLSIVTMDMPEKFEAQSILAKKLSIISHIKKQTADEIAKSTLRGQYRGYPSEEKVNPNSQTETFAALKLYIDTIRWQGVPFYFRTGKKLTGKVTSIIIQFKEKGHKLFENLQDTLPNHVTLQIQPNEGIGIRLVAKKPGLATTLEPVDMEFCYKTSFDVPQPDAYKRLLIDIISGDQSLFLSQDIIEESWKVIDPIEEVWQSGKPKLAIYKPGSWGPKEADDLIEKDGRQWLAPLLTICKI